MPFRLALALLGLTAALAPAAPPITSLAYRPDGGQLAAGGRGVVTLIDAKSGDVTGTLPGQDGRVTALAYSAGHLAAASGGPGKSGVVRVYPAGSEVPITFAAHTDAVYALAFSPDGKSLATGSYDRTIKLWALPVSGPKPAPAFTLTDHSDAVTCVAFHPAGKLLVSGSADRTVKVWDAATGKRLYTLSDPTDWVQSLAWTPDGATLIAAGVDRRVRTWKADATGGTPTGSAFAHEGAVTHVLAAGDPARLVTVGADRGVKAWGLPLRETLALPAPPESVLAAALAPDGKQLALGLFDGTLQLRDVATGKVTATPLPAKPKPPVFAADASLSVARGGKSKLTLRGANLADLTAVSCSRAGVKVSLDSKAAGQCVVTVEIAASVPLGKLELVAEGPGGKSTPVAVWVDRFPVSVARTLTLSATVAGQLDRMGAVDGFAFEAKAGEPVGVHLRTAADGSKFAPHLSLSDAAGRVVAENAGNTLAVTCPTAGRYVVAVRDLTFRGGPELAYQLDIGAVPVVSGVEPFSVARGVPTGVRLRGVHLGAAGETPITVTAAAGPERVPVPLPPALQAEGVVGVAVGEFPLTPLAADGTATLAALPGSALGVLSTPGVVHTVRFAAKKGVPVVVEVDAARLGSPVDSLIEITDDVGKVVPRMVLRCTAKAFVTFRDHDSANPGIRLEAWNELAVDDHLYADGELMRIREMPPTPDDDCRFYAEGGRRLGFLGTTPKHHANGTPLYKVELHPPGYDAPPNGMPTFTVPYRNDDARGRGADSALTFTPPADGSFAVRVRDARGQGGQGYAYRLTVRPPNPRFTLSVTPGRPGVWAGGGVPVTVTAKRFDDFDGPISLRFANLPAGFSAPDTTIEAGQFATAVALSATAEPQATGAALGAPAWAARTLRTPPAGAAVEGTAGSLRASVPLDALSRQLGGDISTYADRTEVTIRPGQQTRLKVRIERAAGFAGHVPVTVSGLPHGVRVIDIGLNGILITPDRTEREIVLQADPWVKPTTRPFVISAKSERRGTEHAAPAVVLRVE